MAGVKDVLITRLDGLGGLAEASCQRVSSLESEVAGLQRQLEGQQQEVTHLSELTAGAIPTEEVEALWQKLQESER